MAEEDSDLANEDSVLFDVDSGLVEEDYSLAEEDPGLVEKDSSLAEEVWFCCGRQNFDCEGFWFWLRRILVCLRRVLV